MGYVLFGLLVALLLVLRYVARRAPPTPPHFTPPAVSSEQGHHPYTPAPYAPRESAQARHDRFLLNVSRPDVSFWTKPVMNDGEWDTFRAGLNVTGQPMPGGIYPYYMFPQVALGQVLRSNVDGAHEAINSKRCDLLIADRYGKPVAVVEYQGSGHNLGGDAAKRDRIKQIALGKAGVQFVEIPAGTSVSAIESAIRGALSSKQGRAGYGHESHAVH